MSQIEVERFLGRLMTDAQFRRKAATSLGSACFAGGYALSRRELDLLERIDFPCFSLLEEILDDSLKRT